MLIIVKYYRVVARFFSTKVVPFIVSIYHYILRKINYWFIEKVNEDLKDEPKKQRKVKILNHKMNENISS